MAGPWQDFVSEHGRPPAAGEPVCGHCSDFISERCPFCGQKGVSAMALKKRGQRTEDRGQRTEDRGQGGEQLDVAVTSIDRSPYQPRQSIPEGEIADLATSIRRHGLLQRPIVRKKGRRYELVCGERRLRAAKVAGLKKIPVEVRQMGDGEAAVVAAIENLHRRNLSAIERGRAYKTILDETGKTQVELAKEEGVSQPDISNSIRLLKLPEPVRKKIISGEIPPTHAREMLPIAEHAKICRSVLDSIDPCGIESVDDFRWTVADSVGSLARPLAGKTWDKSLGERVPNFESTAEQRAQLGIVTLDSDRGEFATNTQLWDKLQAEHVKRIRGAGEQGSGGKKKAAAKTNGKATKSKPLTAAEKKQQAAEEKRRARKQDRQFRRRLWDWRINWQRWLISEWIRDEGSGMSADLLRFALLVDVQWMRGYQWDRSPRLAAILRGAGVKATQRELLEPMFDLESNLVFDVATEFLAAIFWDAGAPNEQIVPAGDVERLGKRLKIDLESAWLNDQAGPMSEPFWNLHSKEQLVALSKELKVEMPAAGKKADLVAAFLAKRPKDGEIEVGIDMPKELAKARKPK